MISKEQIAQNINLGHYELLRFMWCDNSNMIRTKSIYLPAYLERLKRENKSANLLNELEDEITISAALQSLPATQDAPAAEAGLAPVEDIRLVPAWETFAVAPGEEKIGTVLTNMVDGRSPWVHDPRNFLQRMEQRLAGHNLTMQAGIEIEFYLLAPSQDSGSMPVPVDQTVYASSLAAHKSHQVIGDILRWLWKQDVPPEQYNPESGPGQQEITIEHCGPLQLADRLVRARETIRSIANDHDLTASFLPVIFPEATSSGMHVHMSLWQDGRNLMAGNGKSGLSETSSAFMAGVLKHLPALMAVTTPSKNSYRRIKPHMWTGAYQAWGVANKEAAIRLVTDSTNRPNNFELKTFDATANPYIALGCLIAAGLDGIEMGEQLPDPVEIDPANFSNEERAQLGIHPLPQSLEKALEYFARDQALQTAMGPAFAHVFAAVRRAELETMAGLTFEEERLLMLERY